MDKTQVGHGITWFVLCALTLWGSMLSSAGEGGAGVSQLAGGAILAIAFGKSALVMWRFMELRHMALAWRVVFLGWVLALFLLMVLAYWGVLFSLFG